MVAAIGTGARRAAPALLVCAFVVAGQLAATAQELERRWNVIEHLSTTDGIGWTALPART